MDIHHSDAFWSPDDMIPEASDDLVTDGDSATDNEEPVHVQSVVYLNRVPKCLGGSYTIQTSDRRGEHQKNIDEQDGWDWVRTSVDPDAISYIEALASEFENVPTWAGITMADPWTP